MKRNWKRIAALVLAVVLTAAVFAGCAPAKSYDVRIGAMKGPTGIGLAKLLNDSEAGEGSLKVDFMLAGSADELTPKLVKGELDAAAVPANLASVLWNKTGGDIVLLAVNNLGVLYVVEMGDTVKTVADLKGKTLYATGKGSTPEYTLRYILSMNGLDPDRDVTVEWKSEPTEVVPLLASGGGIAMLPQPYVTAAGAKLSDKGMRVALDLNAEWNAVEKDAKLITGVLVARREFVENNADAVKALLKAYESSVSFARDNAAEAAAMVGHFEIAEEAIAAKAIPFCNLQYMDGAEMKSAVSGYLTVLFNAEPKSVGGALPDDGFYYAP